MENHDAHKYKPWSDDECRHLIAKGSITPLPPTEPRIRWLRVFVCTAIGIGLAFAYGVWVK